MKNIGTTLCLFLPLLVLGCGRQGTEQVDAEAMAAVDSWVALVDEGRFEESWEKAAGYFQGVVSREDWVRMVRGVRQPLGTVQSRELKSAIYERSLPGAPDGEYYVVQYDARFDHKRSAVETVTVMKEDNGAWRVSGYYLN